jgi:hypothetical protein
MWPEILATKVAKKYKYQVHVCLSAYSHSKGFWRHSELMGFWTLSIGLYSKKLQNIICIVHFSCYSPLKKPGLRLEGESVNRSQMDIKRKTCDIRTWNFFSRHILHQYWYTCPIALPVRRNQQHRSLLTVVSAISAPPFQLLRHQRNVPVENRYTRKTLPTKNRKHFFMNILCIESSFPQKKNAQQNAALRQ